MRRFPVESGSGSFADFVRQVRAGDARATEELVRRYAPAIRLKVQPRLSDTRLNRLLDAADICQSVLANFFERAALGQFELDRPEQLLKLLMVMARNEVAFQARKQRARRRDNRRIVAVDPDVLEAIAIGPDPSQLVASREILCEFHRRLTAEELGLAELRAQGCTWAEIATDLGGSSQARRKQLARALDRVARELGLTESTP